jgi:hypothetical protein
MRNILKLHSGTQSGTPISSQKSRNFSKNEFSMGEGIRKTSLENAIKIHSQGQFSYS